MDSTDSERESPWSNESIPVWPTDDDTPPEPPLLTTTIIRLDNQQCRKEDAIHLQDGDTVIKITEDPTGILLVHSDTLKHQSEWFNAMFSGAWHEAVSSFDGKKNWMLELFFDRELGLGLLKDKVSSHDVRPRSLLTYGGDPIRDKFQSSKRSSNHGRDRLAGMQKYQADHDTVAHG